MGNAAFHELRRRRDAYDIVLLLRPSQVNKRIFAPYEGGKSTPARQKSIVEHDGLKIVWGDLTSYGDVLEAVTGVDFVLHPAAFISPAADHQPDLAEKINVGAAENLVLRAGHWCPECLPPIWDYDRIARKNPFFAQIYYPNHDRDENNTYDARCFEYIV